MRLTTLIVSKILLLWLASSAYAVEESIFLYEGEEIKLYYFAPNESFTAPRLAILVAGGSNDEYMAQAQYWIGKEMVDRGWAIAVPISPAGRKYFAEKTGLFSSLISFIQQSHDLYDSKPLLLGISEGGSSALAIAAENPSLFAGVIATPGRIWDSERVKDLNGLPVYLRIGEKDSYRWHKLLPEMVNTLHNAGANVDAAIMPDAKHLFELNWNNFDQWLENVKQLN